MKMMCGHSSDKRDALGNYYCWRVACKPNPLRYLPDGSEPSSKKASVLDGYIPRVEVAIRAETAAGRVAADVEYGWARFIEARRQNERFYIGIEPGADIEVPVLNQGETFAVEATQPTLEH